jgi:hypothetical protein
LTGPVFLCLICYEGRNFPHEFGTEAEKAVIINEGVASCRPTLQEILKEESKGTESVPFYFMELEVARPEGFEPPTFGFEVHRSIH